MKKKNLIALDLGGVCVTIQPENLMRKLTEVMNGIAMPPEQQQKLGQQVKQAYEAFSQNGGGYQARSQHQVPGIAELCGMLERGEITDDFFFGKLHEISGKALSVEALQKLWSSQIGDPISGTMDAVQLLQNHGFEFVFFSNTSQFHLTEVERKCPICQLVKDGIYSFDAHAMKPTEAIYEYFEARYGIPCAFFDDRIENIEAARKRGWNAIKFEDPRNITDAFLL